MADQITVSACKQYLVVRSDGPIDVEEMKITISNIDAKCKELGIDKVLVDSRERKTVEPSKDQLMEIGMFLADWTRGKIQFAILVRFKPSIHDFFKAVTEFSGAVVNFFEEESSALSWLGVNRS